MKISRLREQGPVLPLAPDFYAVINLVKGSDWTRLDRALYYGITDVISFWDDLREVTL